MRPRRWAPPARTRPATTSGCTSPATARVRRRSSCAVRAAGSSTRGPVLPGRPRGPVHRAGRARPPRAGARWPPGRPRSWRSSRSGPTPTRPRSTWPSGLAHYAPGDLDRVFFTTGGGEAVESAWKLAKQYFKITGKPFEDQGDQPVDRLPRHPAGRARDHRRHRVPRAVRAARARGVQGAQHQRLPRAARPGGKAFGLWAADRVEEAILAEGADTVAAVFVEPVQNAGGCFPPPPGYFERLREICTRHDVLLVSDEVICAFGRIGSMFACDDFGYVPDIITCAKGMTSGYSPIGAMIASDAAVRAVRHRHGVVPARLHVRRPPRVGGRGDGQPGHLRAGGDQRARAGAVARVPRDPGEAPRPADRRRRARRGLLLRHRAGEGQGDQGDVRRRRERAAAARVPVEGAVGGGAVLPHRRPRRPRHPARPAADRAARPSSPRWSRSCAGC